MHLSNGASQGIPVSPLVFIHGSGDSARCWNGMLQRLSMPDATTLTLDLPGHGSRVQESMAGLDDVGAYAAAVTRLLDQAGCDAVTLVGHSLGSAIALRLARDLPDRVLRLVIVGGGARLRVLPALLEEVRVQGAAMLPRLVTLGFAPDHAALAAHYIEQSQPIAPDALYRDLHACDTFDMSSDLGAISQPALVLVGSEDRLTPPKYATFLAERLARGALEIIPGAGHYLMAEAPDAMAGILRSWLDRTAV